MPLPNDFNSWEHLQSTLRRVHNHLVREEFRELGDEGWDPDISTSRGSLRTACTIDDNDTATMEVLRMFLYYFTLRRARDLQAPIVGELKEQVDGYRVYRPHIKLFFLEDISDVEEDYSPVAGEISYRLMNETSETVTRSELTALGRRIQTQFGAGQGYIWRKGKDLASYTDKANGYQFGVLCRTKSDAKDLIDKVLSTNNDTPNWDKLQYKEPDQPTGAYPTVPDLIRVLGDSRRAPRRRPIAACRFQYATCTLYGKPNPIYLYDRSFSHIDALVNDLN